MIPGPHFPPWKKTGRVSRVTWAGMRRVAMEEPWDLAHAAEKAEVKPEVSSVIPSPCNLLCRL